MFTDAVRFENPCPFHLNLEQYRQLGALGFYGNCRVELLDGVVFVKHPEEPGPCPFPFTREQFRRMGELGFFEGRRVEWVRGELVHLPHVGEAHVAGVALTADALRSAFGPTHYVRTHAPLNLGTIDPEPDIAMVPGGPRDYPLAPTTALLVVEVSEGNSHYDAVTKAAEYATAGIPEYWVLDVAGRTLAVFRDPRPIPEGGAAYRTHSAHGPDDAVSPLAAPSATVKVSDLLP